jgi:hypothetical protein
MHFDKVTCITIMDAPDIRPDNPSFFDILYPAGYQIALRISGRIIRLFLYPVSDRIPDCPIALRISGRIPDIRPDIRLMLS